MIPFLNEKLYGPYDDNGTLPLYDNIYMAAIDSIEPIDSNTVQQPMVLVGEHGAGKTYLLKRISFTLSTKMEDYIPVLIEGRQLFSNDDICRICAETLGIKDTSPDLRCITDWQVQHKVRVVLLIDDIHYYFRRTDSTQHYALRGFINTPQSPMLIGTSEAVLPEFTDYRAAFFDGLRLSYLKPLSCEAALQLIVSNAKERVIELFKMSTSTIRSLKLAEQTVLLSDSPKNDFSSLLDCHSEYYRAKYDACLTQEQRILSALATSECGLSLQGVRELTGQENGKLSPYLGEMIEKGIITGQSTSPRKTIYAIKDNLFRMWLYCMHISPCREKPAKHKSQ